MEKQSRSLTRTSMKYLALLLIVYWSLRRPWILNFQISYYKTQTINLSAYRWPLISLVLGSYLGRVVELVFTGIWVKPLKNSLRYMGLIGLIYLSFSSPHAPDSLRFTSTILLTGTGAMTLLYLMENTVAQSHRLWSYITKSLRYLILGVTGSTMVTRIPEITIIGLSEGFLLMGLLSAGVAFTGYLEEWPITILSVIGERVGKQMRLGLILVSFFSFYGSVFRIYLIRRLGQGAGFVNLFELILVCLIVFMAYRSLRKSVRSEISVLKGNWGTHIQEIENRTDTELAKWSRLADDYILEGNKNLLIVYLFDLLRRNGVSLEQVQVILSPLLDWREDEEKIGLSMIEAQRQRTLQDQRGVVLTQVIGQIQERIG